MNTIDITILISYSNIKHITIQTPGTVTPNDENRTKITHHIDL